MPGEAPRPEKFWNTATLAWSLLIDGIPEPNINQAPNCIHGCVHKFKHEFAHEKISFMTLAMCIIVHRNVKAAQSPEPYDPKFQTRNNQPAVKQENRETSREQGI